MNFCVIGNAASIGLAPGFSLSGQDQRPGWTGIQEWRSKQLMRRDGLRYICATSFEPFKEEE